MTGSSSNFEFCSIWPEMAELAERAKKAESYIHSDPRSSCFYARTAVELLVNTVFEIDSWVNKPRHDASLMSLIHEQSFKKNLKHGLFPKFKLVIKLGNESAHSASPLRPRDALQSVKELHHIFYWFYRTYTPNLNRAEFQVRPFDEALIPNKIAIDANVAKQALNAAEELKKARASKKELERLKALEEEYAKRDEAERLEKQKQLDENEALKKQNEALLAQIAEAKAQAEAADDRHEYNEAETRDYLIDNLLHEAGWKLEDERDREFPVSGMPISKQNPKGNGFVDYVLWDGLKPLALVEAKRTTRDPEEGLHQAKLYADCLEAAYGTRPIIFCTNGYDHLIWDDSQYPSRPVQGFYKKDDLNRLINRRTNHTTFFDAGENFTATINNDITNRYYQKNAITRTLHRFQIDRQRKALVVMATGTGKTRTAISMVDLLSSHGWVKNILFLADRNALLTQAKKNFTKLLPNISSTILDASVVKGFESHRIYFSTYPTMKNLLDQGQEVCPFGVGHFDLIIVDEAHRSVYRKFREIFNYFDGFLVGLTATPKDDVAKDTFEIFDLQKGDPTFNYEAEVAYADKVLVPPTPYEVTTKFMAHGINKDELSEEEQEEWRNLDDLEEREEVLPSEVNTFLFNEDTANKMFRQLFTDGIHVEGGDVIGKTIIFAANNKHAQFLQECFDKSFPKWKGKLAQVITYKNPYAQSLIDEFSEEGVAFDPENPKLRIAISVHMLDTGIDVPEVVNLVFLKVVHSKVKFIQMVGRGTRLCPDLFAPGEDKSGFKIFDYCGNYEFFTKNPDGAKDSAPKSLGERLFEKRVQLSEVIKERLSRAENDLEGVELEEDYKQGLKGLASYQRDMVHHKVSGMNLDNFIVRPKRELLEPFLERDRWNNLGDEDLTNIEQHLSALPSEAEQFNADEANNEMSNRLDNLCLTMQLQVLTQNIVGETERTKTIEIAEKLEQKRSIPAVEAQLPLIQDIQSIEFWQYIDPITIEDVRRRLRNLLFALDKEEKGVVYTNFEDTLETPNPIQQPMPKVSLEMYRKRTEQYIKEHEDHLTIQKLKRNKPVTQTDLEELERILKDASGVSDDTDYENEVLKSKPLGEFIRELIGLDRAAAVEAFGDFLDANTYSPEQINFVEQIITYLTSNGVLDKSQIFDPPFSDMHPEGAFGFFDDAKVVELVSRIDKIKANAYVHDSDVAKYPSSL